MPDAPLGTPAAVIPGIGVCKYCDSTSVPRGCFGAEIDGGACLGCGAPIYALLEGKKPEAAMLTEDDAAEREAAKPRELEYPAGDFA